MNFSCYSLSIKMAKPGPPVFDFDCFEPVTMTVIITYDVQEINLPAIFTLLPVTDRSLPEGWNHQRKQGKIKLPPELNKPGEILSMRYDHKVRGIVRSENARSFSHSIIIDIGTTKRIISVKLSRSTLELTGPTSYEIAREASKAILGQVKACQENLVFIREHLELAWKVKECFLEDSKFETEDEAEKRILEFFKQQSRGYVKNKEEFLEFLLTFDRDLYTGTLELGKLKCEMANILFNLGYPINQIEFARVMNSPPFECRYNNANNASSVIVWFWYTKYERNTDQLKPAKHTIRVNKSGHVKYSGPGLEAMKPVYYAFMQRVLTHHKEIQSVERHKQSLQVIREDRVLTMQEWRDLLTEEEEFRQKVIQGEGVPIAKEPPPLELKILESKRDTLEKPDCIVTTEETTESLPTLQLDYNPTFSDETLSLLLS